MEKSMVSNEVRHVQAGDAKVAYRVDGRGPGLVLLHGAGSDSVAYWSHLVGQFSDDWTVIRPDLAGSGGTVDDGGELDLHTMATQVVEAARAAGFETFDVVGHSLGAQVAVQIAADYPKAVKSMVLASAWPTHDDTRMRVLGKASLELTQSDPRAMANVMLLMSTSPEFVSKMGDAGAAQFVDNLVKGTNWEGLTRQIELNRVSDIRSEAKRVTQPVLTIGCTNDNLIPTTQTRKLASIIPNALYREINSGHMVMFEQPGQFVGLCRGFLRDGLV